MDRTQHRRDHGQVEGEGLVPAKYPPGGACIGSVTEVNSRVESCAAGRDEVDTHIRSVPTCR